LLSKVADMTQLPLLSGREIIKTLARAGYYEVRQRGSHIRLRHKTRRPVTVPNYPTVSRGLLSKILRETEITVAEFADLL